MSFFKKLRPHLVPHVEKMLSMPAASKMFRYAMRLWRMLRMDDPSTNLMLGHGVAMTLFCTGQSIPVHNLLEAKPGL